MIRLKDIASARSGDKGSSANIGVLAHTPAAFEYLKKHLTSEKVHSYFKGLSPQKTNRYEMANIMALNFLLEGVLGGGGSRSLRSDSQGKALGQALLLMKLPLTPEELETMRKS
ncbi:MAG: hypothetical protein K940chlam3_00546 [Chlamydiae bacterium]|nr:hypothetical protein [Chlamydiota bacterium]